MLGLSCFKEAMHFNVLLVVLWMGFASGSSGIDELMEFKGVNKDPSGCTLDYCNQGCLQESIGVL